MILASIRHNLANLYRFSGRDSRALFWPYAVAVILLGIAATFALMVPTMTESFTRMQRFAAEHPELSTVESGPGYYSVHIRGSHPELMPDMSLLCAGIGVIAAVTILLLGAAVTRRLHDRRLRGWWGLLPVPFLAFATAMMPRFFASVRGGGPSDMQLFMAIFFNNALYLLALVVLVVLLVVSDTL